MKTQDTAPIVEAIARLLNLIETPPASGLVLFDVYHLIANDDPDANEDGAIDHRRPYTVDHTDQADEGEAIAWSELAQTVELLTHPHRTEGMTFGIVAVPQLPDDEPANPIARAEASLNRLLTAERALSRLRATAARELLDIDPTNATEFSCGDYQLPARDLTN